MIRLETFALATLSYIQPEGSRHFDSDHDNRATVICQFIYCHAWINRWFADTRRQRLSFQLFSPRIDLGFRLKKFWQKILSRRNTRDVNRFRFPFYSTHERWIFVERDITRPRIIRRDIGWCYVLLLSRMITLVHNKGDFSSSFFFFLIFILNVKREGE